jgi:hypothetical protein
MNLISRTVFAGLVSAGLALCVSTSTCLAEQEPSTESAPTDPTVTRLVELAHANAHAVKVALKELGLRTAAASTDDNRLLLHGTQDAIDKATALIEQLDVPGAGGSKSVTELIQLDHYPHDDLVHLLQAVVPRGRAEFAVDRLNRLLVARAGESDLSTIRRLVETLDRQPQSLTVHLFFIRGTIGGATDAPAEGFPAGLKPVAETLTRNGFGAPSLVAPMIVATDEGESFESQSRFQTTDADGAAADRLDFFVRGHARLQSATGVVQLRIEAAMQGDYTTGHGAAAVANFEVDTTIAAKLGSFVILAASPSSTAQGDAIALAVRVTQD